MSLKLDGGSMKCPTNVEAVTPPFSHLVTNSPHDDDAFDIALSIKTDEDNTGQAC